MAPVLIVAAAVRENGETLLNSEEIRLVA